MREILHLHFNPTTVAWIGGLQAKLANSSCSKLRERYKSWCSVHLDELALAVATRLAICRRVEERLRHLLSSLTGEVEQSGRLEEVLSNGTCYQLQDEGLAFDICAAVDACFFEWRSLYEVFGLFVRIFSQKMLDKDITEADLLAAVQKAAAAKKMNFPIAWIGMLRENRKLFFHQTAPWLVLEIIERHPLRCGIVVLTKNLTSFEEPDKFVVEEKLIEASIGLRQSIALAREWLENEVVASETEAS